jgi:hypothetical protein
MAYRRDFAASARRHLRAAELLDTGRRDVAGYLFGIAAECALKEMMRDSGMRPLEQSQRRDDPFYAHFEALKTLLRDRIQGRRAGELRRYAEDSSFMQNWDTDMRYAPSSDIVHAWVDRWREQARLIVGAM